MNSSWALMPTFLGMKQADFQIFSHNSTGRSAKRSVIVRTDYRRRTRRAVARSFLRAFRFPREGNLEGGVRAEAWKVECRL